jgi:hypothetical protein
MIYRYGSMDSQWCEQVLLTLPNTLLDVESLSALR